MRYSLIIIFTLFCNAIYAQSNVIAIITADSVRIRENPSLEGKVLGNINKSEKVEVVKRSEQKSLVNNNDRYWFLIKTNKNIIGWVFGLYLDHFDNYRYIKYISKNSHFYNLSDLGGYEFTNIRIEYSFRYPEIWTISDSIINDYQGDKIGEILPGGILLNNHPLDLLLFPKDDESPVNIVSNALLKNNKYKCRRVIEMLVYSGGFPEWNGIWYPTKYILENNNKFFQIILYQKMKIDPNLKIFDEIANSIEFE